MTKGERRSAAAFKAWETRRAREAEVEAEARRARPIDETRVETRAVED